MIECGRPSGPLSCQISSVFAPPVRLSAISAVGFLSFSFERLAALQPRTRIGRPLRCRLRTILRRRNSLFAPLALFAGIRRAGARIPAAPA